MTQDHTLVERKRVEYEDLLNALLQAARQDGIVLAIDSVALEPLRMGGYGLLGQARLANELYRRPS